MKQAPPYDVERVRQDFPALKQRVHDRPLIYLDNAATTQKPQSVIDTVSHFYTFDCSNVHRGVHTLSERATHAFEESRKKAQRFINAPDSKEVIFVRGTTEAINLVAWCYGRTFIQRGDEIVISYLEHHSNIVPWQMLCQEKGAELKVIPINKQGEVLPEEFARLLTKKTKFVALAHVSNSLGTITPVKRLIQMAHEVGAPVLVDGAQAAPHLKVDVQDLDCDFYTFSSHKVYGPTGIGVLYGKAKHLDAMPPYQGGGDMIRSVTFEKTLYNALPYKFEAGTPNIADTIGFGAALDYVTALGIDKIGQHETQLLNYATSVLSEVPGIRLIGTAAHKAAVVSFEIDGVHPHDVGTLLDQEGIAIRTGHHCAQPVMDFFGVPATCRASFGLYNTYEEIDALTRAIVKVKGVFA